LGPVLLFGSGGVMVEVYNDVALRRCPLTRSEAQAMIAEVKGARLLQGFRGRPAADLEALADSLVRMSYLATHIEGHLAELDINPLMVMPSGQGVKAVKPLRASRRIEPQVAESDRRVLSFSRVAKRIQPWQVPVFQGQNQPGSVALSLLQRSRSEPEGPVRERNNGSRCAAFLDYSGQRVS
jgi:hypothetical protein